MLGDMCSRLNINFNSVARSILNFVIYLILYVLSQIAIKLITKGYRLLFTYITLKAIAIA